MIREAYRHDIPALVEMMRDYSAQAPVPVLRSANAHDADHVARLFFELIAGRGFVLVDDQHRGFIAAIITPNIWCPSVRELHELAWWVKTEHRNSTVGGRLWNEFNHRAGALLVEKKIDFACTSVLANSPLIDYTKRGYQTMEATFFRDK